MSIDDQSMAIPESFLALAAGRRPPRGAELAELRQRHELCEDLAQTLVAQAQALAHDDGLTPEDILAGMQAALGSPQAGLSEAEAGWAVQRLAELLGWPR